MLTSVFMFIFILAFLVSEVFPNVGDEDTMREPVKDLRFITVNFPLESFTIDMDDDDSLPVPVPVPVPLSSEGMRRKSTPLKESVIALLVVALLLLVHSGICICGGIWFCMHTAVMMKDEGMDRFVLCKVGKALRSGLSKGNYSLTFEMRIFD